jgi:LPXTG-site transpeptidase (sortase) family protein
MTTLAKRTSHHRIEKRRRLSGFGLLIVILASMLAMTATVSANAPIVSTKTGEMPTTGGLRPGPIGLNPPPVLAAGVTPVAIKIENAGVDAEVETIQIVDGKMEDPTGPWVVSWYKETAKLGELGNAVMAGHLDYWDVGPAVFYNVGSLQPKDPIQVTGDDGELFTYEVDWVKNYDSENAPISDIVGPTDNESLTLITCGGPFDYQNGVYLQRTVVRAHRVPNPPTQ